MTVLQIAHPTLDDRTARGADARDRTPLDSHAGWKPAADRPDPVGVLEAQDASRDADLVPVRHGRMMFSPFTFYRGAAAIMAADLKDTPTAGLDVQLCGDAHLSNFGAYASPERTLVFDLNDFDETLPGPFEYDVKRMAASFTIAARNNGFSKEDTATITRTSVTAYREAMAEFSRMRTLDIYYTHMSEGEILKGIQAAIVEAEKPLKGKKALKVADKTASKARAKAEKTLTKAHSRDSLSALAKLAERVDGKYRIVSQPPIVVPGREIAATYGISAEEIDKVIRAQFRSYRATLQDDRRALLERFEIVDFARKVVGVGSVGTRAFIVLLQGRDDEDPLFLQIKEATTSVLEGYLPKSRYKQHGERVVQGQRRMQAASDIFLGWTKGVDVNRHFYWRQLRDMKGSVTVETLIPRGMAFYAKLCGQALARGHARSGDPVAIAAYLGVDDTFDRAITDFSRRYAAANESDYAEFTAAVRTGRLQAVSGV